MLLLLIGWFPVECWTEDELRMEAEIVL